MLQGRLLLKVLHGGLHRLDHAVKTIRQRGVNLISCYVREN